MTLARGRRSPGLLSLALVAGLAVGVGIAAPAGAAAKRPASSHGLSHAAIRAADVPGTYKIRQKTIYWGSELPQAAVLEIAGVPATTTTVKINWGDTTASTVGRTTKTVNHYYAKPGGYSVSVRLTAPDGQTEARAVGRVTVKKDTWAPKVSVKTPKQASKVSSWKTIQGTFSDRGIGRGWVGMWLVQQRGKSWYGYRYNAGKKKGTWVKAKDEEAAFDKSSVVEAVPAKGKWRIKVTGLKVGVLHFFYDALDGNYNYAFKIPKLRSQRLTR
jgi:5'-nucleotidase